MAATILARCCASSAAESAPRQSSVTDGPHGPRVAGRLVDRREVVEDVEAGDPAGRRRGRRRASGPGWPARTCSPRRGSAGSARRGLRCRRIGLNPANDQCSTPVRPSTVSPPRRRLLDAQPGCRVRVGLVGAVADGVVLVVVVVVEDDPPGRQVGEEGGVSVGARKVVVGELERPLVGGQHELAEAGELEVLADGERAGERDDHPLDRLEGRLGACRARRRQRHGRRRWQRVARRKAGDPAAGAGRRRHLGHAEELVDLTADLRRGRRWRPPGTSRGRTRTAPRTVAGSASTSASSSWTKKPSATSWRVNSEVTTPSTMTSWPSSGLAGPSPWTSEINVIGRTDTVDRAAHRLRRVVVGGERDRHGVGAGGGGRGDLERGRAGSRRRQRDPGDRRRRDGDRGDGAVGVGRRDGADAAVPMTVVNVAGHEATGSAGPPPPGVPVTEMSSMPTHSSEPGASAVMTRTWTTGWSSAAAAASTATGVTWVASSGRWWRRRRIRSAGW